MITLVTLVTMVTMVNTLKIRRAVTRLPIQGMSQQSCGHDPIGLSHYVRKVTVPRTGGPFFISPPGAACGPSCCPSMSHDPKNDHGNLCLQ